MDQPKNKQKKSRRVPKRKSKDSFGASWMDREGIL